MTDERTRSSSSSSSSSSSDDDDLDAALDALAGDGRLDGLENLLAAAPSGEPLEDAIRDGSVLGEFELIERLGGGGMGIVFRARQRSVGRIVAVKILRNPYGIEQRRFLREIEIVGRLDHDGIVPIVAAGVEGGIAYFAMHHVPGLPFAKVIRLLKERSRVPPRLTDIDQITGTAPPGSGSSSSGTTSNSRRDSTSTGYARWVARLACQVADALQYAHEQGVVHRDVKPGNMILTPEGRPILVDFGLAASEHGDETLTRADEFLGTLAYASPEQVRGGAIDTRTDVYSLGATLYELVTLRRPFDAPSRDEVRRLILDGDPPPLPSWVPRDLRTICLKALARDPADRYATPGAMAHDLREMLAGRPILARPLGLAQRLIRTVRRHPRLSVAVAVLLIAVSAQRIRNRVVAHQYVADARAELDASRRCTEGIAAGIAAVREIYEADGDSARWMRYEDLTTERERIRRLESDAAGHLDRAEGSLMRASDRVLSFQAARRCRLQVQRERLRLAALLCRDVLDRDTFAKMITSLRDLVDDDVWCDDVGTVCIDSSPPGARMVVLHDDLDRPLRQQPVVTTVAGREMQLPAGSYVAVLTLEGCAETRFPFVVRRPGCYASDPDAHPPRRQIVMLLPNDQAHPDFVPVPTGWTLVEDDPPRWQLVEGFQIARHEVTFAEWLTMISANHENVDLSRSWRAMPRFGDNPDRRLVELNEHGWAPIDGIQPTDPVRGINWNDASRYAQYLQRNRPSPPGWYFSLPTVAEWTRAARGSDGRRYPWGDTFDPEYCCNYLSRDEANVDGSFDEDRSPFGAMNMAGSVHEPTADARPIDEEFTYRGGSFESFEPAETMILRPTYLRSVPMIDAGMRLAMRPLPAWIRRPPPDPENRFVDEFDRDDSERVGGGWAELRNFPLTSVDSPTVADRCSIVSGRLRLVGGHAGDSANRAIVARRIPHWANGATLRVELAALHARTASEDQRFARGLRLELVSGFQCHDVRVFASVGADGSVSINLLGDAGRRLQQPSVGRLNPEDPHRDTDALFENLALDLHVTRDRIELRWAPAGQTAAAGTHAIELKEPLPTMNYALIGAMNVEGVTVDLERVVIEPVDD